MQSPAVESILALVRPHELRGIRSQFSRLLAHGSFDELLRKMREKE